MTTKTGFDTIIDPSHPLLADGKALPLPPEAPKNVREAERLVMAIRDNNPNLLNAYRGILASHLDAEPRPEISHAYAMAGGDLCRAFAQATGQRFSTLMAGLSPFFRAIYVSDRYRQDHDLRLV